MRQMLHDQTQSRRLAVAPQLQGAIKLAFSAVPVADCQEIIPACEMDVDRIWMPLQRHLIPVRGPNQVVDQHRHIGGGQDGFQRLRVTHRGLFKSIKGFRQLSLPNRQLTLQRVGPYREAVDRGFRFAVIGDKGRAEAKLGVGREFTTAENAAWGFINRVGSTRANDAAKAAAKKRGIALEV